MLSIESKIQNFQKLMIDLDAYEKIAFDHEKIFLDELIKMGKPVDLIGLSFGSSGLEVKWLDVSGQHLRGLVSTDDFLKWMERNKEKF